jgi:uncharacterized RDD family membrane protein YckC
MDGSSGSCMSIKYANLTNAGRQNEVASARFAERLAFESSRWQATPGKLLVGLRVTTMNGKRPGFWRVSLRYFLGFLSAMAVGVGFFRIFLSEKRQAFHDAETGTLVLLRDQGRPMHEADEAKTG